MVLVAFPQNSRPMWYLQIAILYAHHAKQGKNILLFLTQGPPLLWVFLRLHCTVTGVVLLNTVFAQVLLR